MAIKEGDHVEVEWEDGARSPGTVEELWPNGGSYANLVGQRPVAQISLDHGGRTVQMVENLRRIP